MRIRTTAIAILALALAAAPVPPAGAATATLTLAVSPGNYVAMSVSPSQFTWSADVASPGASWTFMKLPGDSQGRWGWVYTVGGAPACLTVTFSNASTTTQFSVWPWFPSTVPVTILVGGLSTDPFKSLGPTCPSSPPQSVSYSSLQTSGSGTVLASATGLGVFTATYYLALTTTASISSPVTFYLVFGLN
jgi:hypothetical protein